MEKIKAGYRREMNHNYMIIEAFSDDTECYESRMLSGNTIEGLLKFRQKITETGIEFYYEITSKQPLSRLLEGRLISYEEIKEILKSIHNKDIEKVVIIEREFSKIFDGGCHTPMGCHCILNGDKITLTGIYFKGETGYSASITEDAVLGIKTAQKLADIIKEKIND